MAIGKRIKELRISKGLRLSVLADRCGLFKQTLYKYENDITTNVPSDKIELIAKELNTSPSYLMGWTDNPSPFEEKSREEKIEEIHDLLNKLTPDQQDRVVDLIRSLIGNR